jgi:hypothetical protein
MSKSRNRGVILGIVGLATVGGIFWALHERGGAPGSIANPRIDRDGMAPRGGPSASSTESSSSPVAGQAPADSANVAGGLGAGAGTAALVGAGGLNSSQNKSNGVKKGGAFVAGTTQGTGAAPGPAGAGLAAGAAGLAAGATAANALGLPGLPGSPSAGERAVASAASASAAEKKTPPAAACETIEFASGARKLSAYKAHVITLPNEVATDTTINAKSFCVRMDNVPVAFELQKNRHEVHLGRVLRGTGKLTVSFCRGDAKCAEGCAVPKDEFMEALAGIQGELSDENAATGWVGTDENGKKKGLGRDEQDLEKEMSKLSAALGEDGARGTNADWKSTERTSACGLSVAKR